MDRRLLAGDAVMSVLLGAGHMHCSWHGTSTQPRPIPFVMGVAMMLFCPCIAILASEEVVSGIDRLVVKTVSNQ